MKLPKIKKEISLFLSSEEAKILRKDVVKLGLTATAIATVMSQMAAAEAQVHNDAHGDSNYHQDGNVHDDYHNDDFHGDTPHVDNAHGDSVAPGHSDAVGGHVSAPAAYDAALRRGGHDNRYAHQNNPPIHGDAAHSDAAHIDWTS